MCLLEPLHPTNLLNQNEANIMQWYAQMSGTNKPEWASVLLFWSMYTFFLNCNKTFLTFDFTWKKQFMECRSDFWSSLAA